MRFGVIGSGDVGRTLAAGLKQHSYDVRIASRTPAKLEEFSRKTGIPAATFEDTAAWAEGLVLAVKGASAEEALQQIGAAALEGKLVIDTTNPIAPAAPEDAVLRFFTTPNSSLLEQLQAAFPRARFVKAFNSVGHASMVNPSFPDGKPTMFYCGNDEAAKKIVAGLIDQFGWEGADMGTAKAARAIEPLCQLWCIPGFREQSWTHAFRLLKR